MKFALDEYNKTIQGFAPSGGVQLGTGVGGAYLRPGESKYGDVYKLGGAVDITLDGQTVSYSAGELVVLRRGITYEFSAVISAHEM